MSDFDQDEFNNALNSPDLDLQIANLEDHGAPNREPNAFVSPARIEDALNKYRCKRCGNFHVERPCGGRTEWVWALAEVLDYELRCADPAAS